MHLLRKSIKTARTDTRHRCQQWFWAAPKSSVMIVATKNSGHAMETDFFFIKLSLRLDSLRVSYARGNFLSTDIGLR